MIGHPYGGVMEGDDRLSPDFWWALYLYTITIENKTKTHYLF